MDYISVQQAAQKWNISERRVQNYVRKTEFPEQFGSVMRGRFRKILKNPQMGG